MQNKKIFSLILLFLILIGAFVVRLYRFNNPIADWHSWRQADTSAVSRYFVQHGYDILHPHFEDISNVPSGLENPQGYRFVEFPIYNVEQAFLSQMFPFLTLEEWGRMVSILASLLTIVFLYLLIKKYTDSNTAIFVAFLYAFIPYNIYYNRTILPDTSMVTAIIGGIYFFDKWLEQQIVIKNHKSTIKTRLISFIYFALSLLFTTAAFLLKPYALFFTLPMIYLAIIHFRWKIFLQWKLYIYLIVSVVPLIWWRSWMQQWPAGIPASSWLFNGNGIRFKPAYFYWLYADRLGRLIMGYWGMFLFLLGISYISSKTFFEKYRIAVGLLISFILSSFIYITVIATGNVQHDYYQILIVPSIAIFAGVGCSMLFKSSGSFINPIMAKILLFVTLSFMLFFGWYFVRTYFDINNPSIVVAGEAVNKLTPKDAKVIASYNGDTSFLYQTNRQGWPVFAHSLSELIQMGADYMIFANPAPNELAFKSQYRVVAETPQYIIYNLHEKP